MKFCPIVPIPELQFLANSDTHLLLAHIQDELYWRYYAERRTQGDYIILDNSAYERGEAVDVHRLEELARKIGAQEIVASDIMQDSVGTLERVRHDLTRIPRHYRIMIVPQGEDVRSWRWCFDRIIDAFYTLRTDRPVVGLSKVYEKFHGGRYGLLEWIFSKETNKTLDVHLLGYEKPTQVEVIQNNFPQVRSVDSAKPVVAAINGIRYSSSVSHRVSDSLPKRPDDFFYQTLDPLARMNAEENIEFIKKLADGSLTILR